ncbi:alpha/beta hydrolase [Frankia sp. CNm7]|uniref:Alpha/beta hydrolase n=1 Tax=Frankia nepalensis TaxID=1836974 RepID=A0A937RID6_9ACTN|nr:alpha/beta hydrolase [Frankia nepalensis]MBL7499972.1 alpha/beta hydrolase [Frankia nepalensis]MBL7512505.1 alpha/beta hydrolase [Frankia nepalensis]MBL7517442.1 alpha/beta hydrolase [Frankia nepalensis]MBL7632808.1 alpha/beta hydrolase [Frankia nepalensis]
MTSIVLVHGGGFGGSCWELLLPHLTAPAIAVDLPGRGAHPADPASVTFAGCAESVAADVDAAGFDDVVLVGHSMAGGTIPRVLTILGDRVRHAVFVACTVPDDGRSCLDMIDPAFRARAVEGGRGGGSGILSSELARVVFGNDLDDEQFAWCRERMVPEAPGLPAEPVYLAPLRSPTPRTWVRTLRDVIVPPDRQLHYVANVSATNIGGADVDGANVGGDCQVIDLDAGHMCMISQPAALATILNKIAASC